MDMSVATRIQNYLRSAASRGREVLHVGPFLLTIDPESENPYLNYAIPADGAEPTPQDVEDLVHAYESRGRTPRFEYLAELAPSVEDKLLTAGFVIEGRLPLMTCVPGEVLDLPIPPGIKVSDQFNDSDLWDTCNLGSEAFGAPAAEAHDVERFRNSLTAGMIALLARSVAGDPAGAGMCTPPKDGITEVAGIGVRPTYQRQGIGGFITAELTKRAFDTGVELAFLMAGHDGAERTYERAGFTRIGRVLHISRPSRAQE